jgi:hypothetical protein
VVVVVVVVLTTYITVDAGVGSERHSQAVVSKEHAKPWRPDGAPLQRTGVAVVFVLVDVVVVFVLVEVGLVVRFSSAFVTNRVRFFLLMRPTHVLDPIVLLGVSIQL